MKRRSLLFANLALPFASAHAEGELQVIYIGGGDCPYCRSWKNKYKDDWRASPLYGRVRWIEVESAMLQHAYRDQYWPSDLRPIRDQLPEKSGVPRFLIVKNGRVVSNEVGANRWTATLATLQKLLG